MRLRLEAGDARRTFATRRTQHADFPHCALLFASPQGLWGLAHPRHDWLMAAVEVATRGTRRTAGRKREDFPRAVAQCLRRMACVRADDRAGTRDARIGDDVRIHAIAAPAFAAIVSFVYFGRFRLTTPLATAACFTLFVVFMDALVVRAVLREELRDVRQPARNVAAAPVDFRGDLADRPLDRRSWGPAPRGALTQPEPADRSPSRIAPTCHKDID